jgi:hypothetical protein
MVTQCMRNDQADLNASRAVAATANIYIERRKRPRQSVTNCGEGVPEGCRAASNIKRNPMRLEVRSRLMSANLEGDDVGGEPRPRNRVGIGRNGSFWS